MSHSDLFEVFKEEATEAVAALSKLLLNIETIKEGPAFTKAVNEMFRYAHSLKGSAFAAARPDIAQIADQLEGCLDRVRKQQIAPNAQIVDAALKALDLITAGLERPLQPTEILESGTLIQTVSRPGSGPAREKPAAPQAAPSLSPATAADAAQATRLADGLFQALAMLGQNDSERARAAAAQAADLLALNLKIQQLPHLQGTVELLRDSLRALTRWDEKMPRALLTASLMAMDFIQSTLATGQGTLDEAQAVEVALRESGVQPATAASQSPALEATKASGQPSAANPVANEPASAPTKAAAATVRVPVSLMDGILFRLDELVAVKLRLAHQCRVVEESQAMLEQLSTKIRATTDDSLRSLPMEDFKRKLEMIRSDLSHEVHDLGIVAHSLQEEVKEVRMVPVGPLLDPMRRTVRELATMLGKEASLEIQGEDVRVDKRLLELMREPLLHLLRNAIDHGMETPAEREAAGKPRVGTLRIHAESRDSQVLLEIGDDGRGVDVRTVLEQAIERGLVTKERAPQLTHREILNFIFMPGFSTRSEVTETSGRGVGLDVVRENVAQLGGRIDFYSELGKGTDFVIRLPLTLAAARGLFVSAGKSVFCIPLSNVDEAITIEPQDVGLAQGRLFLQLRRQAISYVGLDELLNARPSSLPSQRTNAVIVALSDRRLALGVDELLGQEEVVVKALAPRTPKIPFVAGGTSLADGRLVTVLEPLALLEAAAGAGIRAAPKATRKHVVTVLVCDDALTTRTMMSSLLERAGYRTLTAPDGEAGFALAVREHVSLVVSDVEMPNLDGLGLCQRIRNHPQLSSIPVILVTSLGEKAELARGAEAGASGYIVKKDFDPALFLDIVADLLGKTGAAA